MPHFFTTGDGDKLVYCASGSIGRARRRLGEVATVVDGGRRVDVRWLSEDLHRRGVRRLMVEGGASVHTQFLTADLADELQLVVAPFFVGNPRANRFVGTAGSRSTRAAGRRWPRSRPDRGRRAAALRAVDALPSETRHALAR